MLKKSNIIKDKTEQTRYKIEAFKFLMLIHQKSHTGKLNELRDITAEEEAIAEISKLFPRKTANEEESARENTQTFMNQISQNKDADLSAKSISYNS